MDNQFPESTSFQTGQPISRLNDQFPKIRRQISRPKDQLNDSTTNFEFWRPNFRLNNQYWDPPTNFQTCWPTFRLNDLFLHCTTKFQTQWPISWLYDQFPVMATNFHTRRLSSRLDDHDPDFMFHSQRPCSRRNNQFPDCDQFPVSTNNFQTLGPISWVNDLSTDLTTNFLTWQPISRLDKLDDQVPDSVTRF